jgi:hypothetical protein
MNTFKTQLEAGVAPLDPAVRARVFNAGGCRPLAIKQFLSPSGQLGSVSSLRSLWPPRSSVSPAAIRPGMAARIGATLSAAILGRWNWFARVAAGYVQIPRAPLLEGCSDKAILALQLRRVAECYVPELSASPTFVRYSSTNV